VVVKPYDGNHGRGVFTNLMTREAVEAAWAVAREEGSGVIVERFVPGLEHRLLVVGGKVVAAARGEAAWVTGDGRSTIRELIESQLNTDPRRGSTEDFPLNPVRIDSAARLELAQQGFEPESVPAAGVPVLIQRNGNVAFDVTDLVHPKVAARVSLAARVVGLDIAGVDVVAEDISRPLEDQRGAIVEVNAGPGLLMHLKPADGEPRPVGRAIVDNLFPEGDLGRIPIVGISGSKGKTGVARIVAYLLQLAGHKVGLACTDGLYLDRRPVERGDCAAFEPARRLLINRNVEAAVVENGPRAIVTEGLAYDRCAVGVVTNLDPDAVLPEHYIETSRQLYNVMRTQIDVVLPDGVGVLNAQDEHLVEMAELCDGEVIWFSADPSLPVVQAHRAAGGRAVLVVDGWVTLAVGAGETRVAEVAAIHRATSGRNGFHVENVLAATGAAWALGVTPELIRAAVETYAAERANGGAPVFG
jgi:cyanophycin synthetase